jgi:hypothetical protein
MKPVFHAGLFAASIAALPACVGPLDDPTLVHDLRILSMRSVPPEYMIGPCPQISSNPTQAEIVAAITQLAEEFAAAATNYQVSALVADPQGGGRVLQYQWTACVDPAPGDADVICPQEPPFVALGGSGGTAGVVSTTFTPTTDLLTAAFEDYQGLVLYGVRFMITLTVTTPDGSQQITGGKRVQLSCQLVPGQTAATNPTFTTISLDGTTWVSPGDPDVSGTTQHTVTPADPSSLEQHYVVPTYTGGSQALTEAWIYDYMATAGHYSSFELGGIDFSGQPVPIQNTWNALTTDPEEDVTYYFLVRNGRGGETWTTRQAHLIPGN